MRYSVSIDRSFPAKPLTIYPSKKLPIDSRLVKYSTNQIKCLSVPICIIKQLSPHTSNAKELWNMRMQAQRQQKKNHLMCLYSHPL